MAERARLRVVVGLLAINGLALSLLTSAPALAAIIEGEYVLAISLAAPATAALAAFLVQRMRSKIETPRKVEAIVAVALAFIVGALSATPAFIALGLSPTSAFFEAMSGVTTTGLSVAEDTSNWPLSAHFLRAWLQWCGAFAFVVLALALVLGPGVVAIRLGAVDRPGGDILQSTRARARDILGAYLGITILAVIFCAALAESPVGGALLALSSVSTGGFSFHATSLSPEPIALQIAVAVFCFIGALSLSSIASLRQVNIKKLSWDPSLIVLASLTSCGVVGIVLLEASRSSEAAAWDVAFLAISAQSTAGFSTMSVTDLSTASIVVLLVMMFVGGCVGSTAGGVKVYRAAFFIAAAQTVLVRTRLSPHALSSLRVLGRKVKANEGADAFGLLSIYLLTTLALWIALVAADYPPLPALFDTISALSTVGLSAGVVGPSTPETLQLAVAFAMLLGRLEFLAVLTLLAPSTWRSDWEAF